MRVRQKLVHRQGFADDDVGLDVDAQGLQAADLLLHDGLGQAEFRDAVHQHAAGGMERLVDGDVIAQSHEIARCSQAGGPGAHHGDQFSVFLSDGCGNLFFLMLVRREPLQRADRDAFSFDPPDAPGFALALLGADPAANGGQGVGGCDDLIGPVRFPPDKAGDKRRDAHGHGAPLHAGRVFAVQAAPGLRLGLRRGIAQSDLGEIVPAAIRGLLRHGLSFQISHFRPPSCGSARRHAAHSRGTSAGA